MRFLIRAMLLWSTFALIGSIVWFPGNVNGADILGYAGLWILALYLLRIETE